MAAGEEEEAAAVVAEVEVEEPLRHLLRHP
jgi:hypothetical protein